MRLATSVCSFVAVLLVAIPLGSQNVNMGRPQEINAQHRQSPEEIRDRLSGPQIQTDAKELADLCALVTTDMDSVKHGLLPKDFTEKLKRMERLSKRMRENLTRASTDR